MTPTTITVMTNSDAVVHNTLSLRDAINLANADAAGGLSDTIVFDSSLKGKTVVLAQGPLELKGTGSITIDGGANQITLSGGNVSSIIKIDAGLTASLLSLTMSNGRVIDSTQDVVAGAVENDGTLTIDSCLIDSNTILSQGGTATAKGGGVYNTGTLTVTNSTVSNSSANANTVQGGGIYSSGSLHLSNTHVDNNSTVGKSVLGAGIFNSGTLIVDTGSTIKNDTSAGTGGPYLGGGIYDSPTGSATLDSVTIQNNSAIGGGGGIYGDITGTTTGAVSIKNSSILNNTGGGVHTQGTLTITSTDIKNNTLSENSGAGVFSAGTTQITGGNISGNSVSCTTANTIASGGVFCTGQLTLDSVTISGNSGTSSGSAVTTGVGVYCTGASLSVTNSTISSNIGSASGTGPLFGAGIYSTGTLTVTGSTITGNKGTTSSTGDMGGAGIYCTVAATVSSSDVSNNSDTATAATGANISGAGIFGSDNLTLSIVTVTGNTASTAGAVAVSGGAIFCTKNLTLTTVTVTGTTVTGVGATNISGAAVADSGTLSISSSTISNNTAATDTGKVLGVGLFTAGPSLIQQSTFANNTVATTGAAAAISGIGIYNTGTMTILFCTISGNVSTAGNGADGGGIFNSGTATLATSTVYGNKGDLGGGLLNGDNNGAGAITISESTFADNQAITAGGGIYNQGNMVLRSTILANGSAPSGPDIGVNANIFSQLLLGEHDLIQNGSGLEQTEIADGVNENIVGHDPMIYDVLANYGGQTDTIPLLVGSPAIGHGGITSLSQAVLDDATTTIHVENTAVFMSTFVGRIVQIDDEQMLITAFDPVALTLTVVRGVNGTTEPHDKFTHVFPTLDQLGLSRVVNDTTDIGASTFIKDITPPTVMITSTPPAITNSTSATFTFTATDDFTPANQIVFKVSMDGGAFTTATSPDTITGLTAGTHTFQVEAIDLQGNIGTTPVFSWIVDLQPPTVSLTQTPPAITNSTSATFAFSGTDNITPAGQLVFETSLDGGAFTTATSPQTLTGLSEGTHTYQVEAFDQAGNSATTSVFSWIVDLTKPTVSITQSPPAATKSTTGTFLFTGSDNVSTTANLIFKVSLDGSAFATATSPKSFTGLSSGDHTFKVESIDQAGNVSDPATFAWTVDAIPPTVQITQNPNAQTMSTSATFAFTGNDNRTQTSNLVFQVSLDGGAFATATSPVNYTNLGVGPHTFSVEAVDEVGNVSAPATFSWVIDQTPPVASITKMPANPTNQTTATFAFTGTDNVTAASNLVFKVSLDGASFSVATSPTSFNGLADGSHTFQVEAIDQAGNVSGIVSYTWVIDTIPPTVSITQEPPAFSNQTTASFTFAGTDNLTSAAQLQFQYSLDGAAFKSAANPLTLSGLSAGVHTFQVESIDQAGNSSSPASFSWTVDTSAPTVSVTGKPPLLSNSASTTFTFTGNDDVTPADQLVFKYSLDSGAFTSTTSPLDLSGLTSGSHTIQFEDIDQAGNVSNIASYTWTVDTVVPTVAFTQTPPLATQSSSATFSFTGSDNLTSASALVFQASLDGSTFDTTTSPVSLTDLAPGKHTFTVQVIDQAGNVSAPAAYSWNVDLTAPTASITQKPPATSFVSTATFAFTGTDDVSSPDHLQFKISLDSSAFVASTSPVSFNNLVLGSHTFQVEAIDQAGNVGTPVSYSWQVATPPPASQLQFSAAGYGTVRTQSQIALVLVRTGSVAQSVTVDYATSDGSAVAGTDYKAATGTITFPVGALTETILVDLMNGGPAGAQGKKFTVTLTNATNGATLPSLFKASVTINDPLTQDPLPTNLVVAASAFTHSQEAYRNFVQQAYAVFLHRPPEQNGINFWTSQMAGGLTDEQLESKFIGSSEYIQAHGGSGAGWVMGMYEDLLGRAPDANGLAFWVGQLKAGVSPVSIALGFAASQEREGNLLAADYEIYLGRAIDDASKTMWLKQFADGTQNEDIIAALVGSTENYANPAKGQQNRAQWVRRAMNDVLHREASDGDVSFWSSFLT